MISFISTFISIKSIFAFLLISIITYFWFKKIYKQKSLNIIKPISLQLKCKLNLKNEDNENSVKCIHELLNKN